MRKYISSLVAAAMVSSVICACGSKVPDKVEAVSSSSAEAVAQQESGDGISVVTTIIPKYIARAITISLKSLIGFSFVIALLTTSTIYSIKYTFAKT